MRQFPQRCTAVLDDKALLAQCLEAAGCAAIAPRTWTDLDAFLEQHGGSGSGEGGGGRRRRRRSGSSGMAGASREQAAPPTAAASTCPGASNGQLYFLKHRHGVKGQAVYPFPSLASLLDRLRSLGSHPSSQQGETSAPGSDGQQGGCSGAEVAGRQRSSSSTQCREQRSATHGGSRQQFVVQEGVDPPLLLPDGRKFTLRAHVLMLLEHAADAAAGGAAQQPQQGRQQQREQREQQQQRHAPRLLAWVHEDVIVTPHAAPLSASSPAAGAAGAADVAVHVSSRGRGHPKPFLLRQLTLEAQQQQPAVQQGQEEGQPAGPAEPAQQHPPTSTALQLQQELWQQICSVSRAAAAAGAENGLVPSRADPQAVLYHLWAFDFAVGAAGRPPANMAASLAAGGHAAAVDDGACKPPVAAAAAEAACELRMLDAGSAAGGDQRAQRQHPLPWRPRVLLLEANSYPAVASGTMAAVPRSVYTRLVGDLLSMVVLPALDSTGERAGQGAAGGFVRVL